MTIGIQGRRRDRKPIVSRADKRAAQALPKSITWCPCGSKMNITNGIKMAGKDIVYACGTCAERAPFCAVITRIDARQFKGHDNFSKVPRQPQPTQGNEKT
jgi:transcription elongation factor Elf1